MTPRQRVTRALTFQEVDRVPIENAFEELQAEFPSDVVRPPSRFGQGRTSGQENRKGRRTDAWGCVFEAGEDGVCGEVKRAPLAGDWSALATYQPPWDVLDEADLSEVDPFCAETDRFVAAMWQGPNLFERMQHLRGTEQLLLDLAYLEPEVYRLRDMVHEFYRRQLELWLATDVDAVHLADDWGSQRALLISPDLWREFFKPLYRQYCELARGRGKLVVMHSDGYIAEIIPDLVEIGVHAVNAQLFCMDIEEIGRRFAGRIAFWGEIDRQRILTDGTPEDARAAVRRVARALMTAGRTGVVGQCFWGKDHKEENIRAVYDEWAKV